MQRALKLTYWLCALVSPLVMYMVYSTVDEDPGLSLELFVFVVGLVSNAFIVWATQSALPFKLKLAIWRRSILVLAISVVCLLLLSLLVLILLFGLGKWNFG